MIVELAEIERKRPLAKINTLERAYRMQRK